MEPFRIKYQGLGGSKQKLFVVVSMLCLTLAACNNDDDPAPRNYPLRLSFKQMAGTQALSINGSYTTPLGEPITITAFKYYISNIELIDAGGKIDKIDNSYFLVDAKDPSSNSMVVMAPGNTYTAIRFVVGVDSARNVSGVQTGALDPALGMFWTWNTGYIMAKLEGKSAASRAPQQGVTYHIGGFRASETVLDPVSLAMPVPIKLKTTGTSEVVLSANALSWFAGANPIKIADDPASMNPGPLAQRIAANYRNMFEVVAVNN
ncbi:MAG: hypothetical protein EAY75_09415 [Bacteroidetes bacterium]|nr:MAG: hypothetical protein EAY75_09415 [Bacteroidota bacterium]